MMKMMKMKKLIDVMLRDKMSAFAAIVALSIFLLFGVGPLIP